VTEPQHPADPLPARLDRTRRSAAEAGVDALLITPGADLRWLVGYHALPLERLTCLVVPAVGEPFLVVPLLEQAAAEASGAGERVPIVTHGETDDAFVLVRQRLSAMLDRAPERVAVSDRMWAQTVLRWQQAFPGAAVTLAGDVLRPLRVVKAPDEVESLRQAGRAIDRVHQRMAEWLRPGRTEREVGRDIAEAIRAEGHAEVNFVIVASGPNAASPHHDLSDRTIELGDPVVVDIGGAMPDGYCSDCTRTYAVGADPEPAFADYYAALLHAQMAACDAVRTGVTAEAVDAVARDAITTAGYGAEFVHRTGHGIGLEEHEEPWIVAGNATRLEPGMAFSIEPGIYLPGRHGARIEDIVVCTAEGVERLDLVDRALTVLS
jgi:Xaa-Pro aminopeptidase